MVTSTRVYLTVALLATIFLAGCSDSPAERSVNPPFDISISASSSYPDVNHCLSVPLIFAEGHGMTGEALADNTGLRGTPGTELFIEPYDDITFIDGYPVYQNPSVNEWQADWEDGTTWGEVEVEVDWANNMTRHTWTERSQVRVEVVLFASLATPMAGYNMYSLGGEKLDEIFVSNTTKYETTRPTVYSNVARLKIEKLDEEGGNPVLEAYNSACSDKYFVDGRNDAYSAEINMSGACIYGYNWDVEDVNTNDRTGWYRLTFSLDPTAEYTDNENGVTYSYVRNTRLGSINPDDLFGSVPEVVQYQPELAPDGYSTTLEIYLKERSGHK